MKMPRGEAAARYVREHGGTLIEAARLFGLSRERVRQKWRDLFGDAELPSREAQRQRLAEIEELARQGLTQTEIAAELGIQRRAVAHLCAADAGANRRQASRDGRDPGEDPEARARGGVASGDRARRRLQFQHRV